MYGGRARENMQNTNHAPEVGLIDLFAGEEDNGCQGRGCLRQELCVEAGRYPPLQLSNTASSCSFQSGGRERRSAPMST